MTNVQERLCTSYDGLLGDTATRDYSRKLSKFNAFAQRELRGLIRGLDLNQECMFLTRGAGPAKP